MIEDYEAYLRSVPASERHGVADWPLPGNCEDGTVLIGRDGRAGVVDTVSLADLIVEDEPEPTDERVRKYVRRIRERRGLKPLWVDLIDGSLVLIDGGCRYVALRQCGRSTGKAIVWCGG